jgi:hypothetical protein
VDDLPVSATARYVRMYGIKRATPYGFSLYELEVYGPTEAALPPGTEADSSALLSRAKPAKASSIERGNVVLLYWPVLMIVAGIPAILVPKDGGDQVMGLVLTLAGVMVQVRTLGLVRWGWGEIMPILLIAAGVILVLQSLRRSNGDQPSGTAASAL